MTVPGPAGRAISRRWWFAALVAVPTALASLSVGWSGRGNADSTADSTVDSNADSIADSTAVTGVAPSTAAIPGAPSTASVRQDPAVAQDRGLLQAQLAQAIAAQPIVFAADVAELTEPPARTVHRVAELLAAAPALPVLVEGHVADTPGGSLTGQELSERRATVVAQALVAAGVAADRIRTHGRGATQPLATREQSRRVEISIR